jgi:Condensation domain
MQPMQSFPLSYAQESLVAHARESAINVPAVVVLPHPVQPAAVQKIVDTLVGRHGALRTVLYAGPDGPTQLVQAQAALPLTVTRHRSGLRDLLPQLLLEGSERPFEFFDAPLARAELHSFGRAEHLLLIWLHHLIGDLVSSQVLAEEAGRLARGEALPDAVPHQGNVAIYERRLGLDAAAAGYWEQALTGVEDRFDIGYPDGTPHLTVRPALPRLPAGVVHALTALGNSQRTTLTAVLATAVLAMHLQPADPDGDDRPPAERVLLGLTVSNRDHPQLRSAVGCLADQLPLVVDVTGRLTFRSLLSRVREALIEAYDHRVPLGALLPLLRRQEPPVFAVNLNFLPPRAGTRPAAQPDELPYGIAKRRADPWWLGDATLAYRPRIDAGGGLAGEVEGDGHLHDAEQVRRFGERFCAVLAAAADDPDLLVRQHFPISPYAGRVR